MTGDAIFENNAGEDPPRLHYSFPMQVDLSGAQIVREFFIPSGAPMRQSYPMSPAVFNIASSNLTANECCLILWPGQSKESRHLAYPCERGHLQKSNEDSRLGYRH